MKYFRIFYFLYIVDQIIDSHKITFEHYNTYEGISRILFSIEIMLQESRNLSKVHDNFYDFDGEILFEKLYIIREEVLTIESK